MKRALFSIIAAAIAVLLPLGLVAQSIVTFRVDMRDQMKDSTLVPSRDEVAIAGNQLPFSSARPLIMKDEAPVDSIYVAKVQFPSIVNGKKLNYHFLIRRKYQKTDEKNKRSLILGNKDTILPVVGFDKRAR